ncbi:uncharacterized protein LOC101214479 isoform X2 [Cucumis sativus]|uniref:uncharacterized protein LOC101214479 isoform X2 n=1 Tax=Cucumis sativus TaxID=3659 RepID=UPI0012F484AB|nr:uncharacterized protein LOC101214479 isoform X2 [Cucumis sativus]
MFFQVYYGTVDSVLQIKGQEGEFQATADYNSSKYQLEPTTQIHGFIQKSETTNCFVQEFCFTASPSSSGNQTPDHDFECYSSKYLCESDDGVKLEIFNAEEGLEKLDEHEGLEKLVEHEGLVSNIDAPIPVEVEKSGHDCSEVETLVEDGSFLFSDSDFESPCFDEEYIEIELELKPSLHVLNNAKILPVNDWSEEESQDCLVELTETEKDEKGMEFFEQQQQQEEEEEEEEFLQEHQDLINQLKIELRNSRTGGLPTVQEEEDEGEAGSMCPTSVETLKPLKKDQNFELKQHFREIQKVYKTYAEKMRKLDISNIQTNYAIGLVKLKDPNGSMDGKKSGLKSVFPLKLRPGRGGVKDCPRLTRDLKRDMEMVYVGHLCLSWELLHWQHRKATELQQNDSREVSRFTRVVNEFQLFSILIQRFIEDEQFCGPRIDNYARNRLFIRSLLQVPAIRADCVNDKKQRGKEDESTISTAALVSIIEDSMQVFREFLRAEKFVRNSTIKCAQGQLNAQRMMMEIRSGLQKKERRLKEILRSGNCIAKKFKRIGEDEGRVKNELLIAEVELKLVSRVVSMSRLTESQLIWCHKKLHQINFVNRKVVIEPSFSLFPC